jgi:hypothetical protein
VTNPNPSDERLELSDALRAGALSALITTALLVVGACVVYAFIPLTGEDSWLGGLIGLATILLVIPVTVWRVRAINTSERPIFEAAEAVVLMLIMLVLGFSAVYMNLSDRQSQMSGITNKIDAVYFTVTTLSTVGFGDVHAVGRLARLVVVLQIATDFALIATGLKLVTGVAQRRAREVHGPRFGSSETPDPEVP